MTEVRAIDSGDGDEQLTSASPPSKTPNAIKSVTTIQLHTRNGVFLFDGQNSDNKRIAGLNRYAARTKTAWLDAKKGQSLRQINSCCKSEEKLEFCRAELNIKQKQLQEYTIPNYQITEPKSTSPVIKTITSVSPYPYIAAQLIVQADQIICPNVILTLRHNAFLTGSLKLNSNALILSAVCAVFLNIQAGMFQAKLSQGLLKKLMQRWNYVWAKCLRMSKMKQSGLSMAPVLIQIVLKRRKSFLSQNLGQSNVGQSSKLGAISYRRA